jgi:hypothetical protein
MKYEKLNKAFYERLANMVGNIPDVFNSTVVSWDLASEMNERIEDHVIFEIQFTWHEVLDQLIKDSI